ncbi:hypothetical protein TWF506_002999 [Arthrobotrys conoides]|uniref:Uncharacterized protein n=1 Tax=Arthrobotrys conoides TaxID=74498 RepID=A0AAN8P6R9_9PEZI
MKGYAIGFPRFGGTEDQMKFSAASNILKLHEGYGKSISHLTFTYLEKTYSTIDTPLGPRGPEIKLPAKDEYLTTGPCLPAFSIRFTEILPNLTTIEFKDHYPPYRRRAHSFNPNYLLPSLFNILSSCCSLHHLKLSVTNDLTLPPLMMKKIESMLPMSTSPVRLQTLSLDLYLVECKVNSWSFHGIWLLDALAYLLPTEETSLKKLDFNVSRKNPINRWRYAGSADNIEDYVTAKQAAFAAKHNRLNRTITLSALRHLKVSIKKDSPSVFLALVNVHKWSLEELDIEDIDEGHHYGDGDRVVCELQFVSP